jgi:hypothetical protein
MMITKFADLAELVKGGAGQHDIHRRVNSRQMTRCAMLRVNINAGSALALKFENS